MTNPFDFYPNCHAVINRDMNPFLYHHISTMYQRVPVNEDQPWSVRRVAHLVGWWVVARIVGGLILDALRTLLRRNWSIDE